MSKIARSTAGRSILTAVILGGFFFADIRWVLPATQRKPAAVQDTKEMLIRIPREGTPEGMLTRVCLTGTRDPAPLVMINHGSPTVGEMRLHRKPTLCGEVAQFFTSRGYTVVFPLRRGYGETGGRWAETYGKCDSADFVAAGEATADDIAVALDYLLQQPYIAKRGTVIIGQSAGGWGTLAFASRNPENIATFINFAGGRGAAAKDKSYSNCSPDALVASAGVFGKSTRQPTLWIYTENDSLIGKELSQRMHAAYTASGGPAKYKLFPPFGNEGHNLFLGKGGVKIWGPVIEQWLASHGPKS